MSSGTGENLTHEHVQMIELPFDDKPFELFTRLCNSCRNAYLLESMEGPEKLAEYSFIGFNPEKTVKSLDGVVTVTEASTDEKIVKYSDPLEVLKSILNEHRVDSDRYRLIGGAVGYISYDAVRMWEKIPDTTVDDMGFPDLEMGVYQDGVVYDHKCNESYYYYINENRIDELSRFLKRKHDHTGLVITKPEVNISKDCFEEAVLRAKDYVSAGDIFQVVLSKRYKFKVDGDLCEFYRALREINPSPYMYFLKMGDRSIIGSSPEMLTRVEGNTVETYPIAGTRPKVEDKAENRVLANELLSDPKERAEHVMLVDLGRNDIGKVSRFGSVYVPDFMEVHQYSHVQHIVSRVVGELKEGCDCYDALKAVFPAGTVSGAPKIRAMEIIEESEPTKRGPYAGAVGYFSNNGNADFAITIRTLVADGDRCYIQVGGGIVADSVPEREWYETEHKAQALFKALEQSEGEI